MCVLDPICCRVYVMHGVAPETEITGSARVGHEVGLDAAVPDDLLEVARPLSAPVLLEDVEHVVAGVCTQEAQELGDVVRLDCPEPLVFAVGADARGLRAEVLAIDSEVVVAVEVRAEEPPVGTILAVSQPDPPPAATHVLTSLIAPPAAQETSPPIDRKSESRAALRQLTVA